MKLLLLLSSSILFTYVVYYQLRKNKIQINILKNITYFYKNYKYISKCC